jgi:hypothetical protein
MAKKPAVKKEETVTENVENTETKLHVGDMVYDHAPFNVIANGTKSEDGYGEILEADAAKLVELGLITVNPKGPDEAGKVQAALTELGKEADKYNEENPNETAAEKKTRRKSDVVTPDATVDEEIIPKPAGGRRGRQGEKYPFKDLTKVGMSFHIATEDSTAKEILGRMHSSVGTANERYKASGEKFSCRAVGVDDPKGMGVRVWRDA